MTTPRRNIIAINGSSRTDSANGKLISALSEMTSALQVHYYPEIVELPLFRAEIDISPWPISVINWRKAVGDAHGVIISTPAYLNNIPALLKNALEWLTTSGELEGKRVLPITFTPHPPRGEKALQSLTWSLQGLKSNIVATLPLYQNELSISAGIITPDDQAEMISEALQLL